MMQIALIAVLATTTGVPSEVERYGRKIGKSPEDVCRAVLNVTLKKIPRISPCVKARGSPVRKILGDPKKCNAGAKGHYTLYNRDRTCQCNASKHSERHVIADNPAIRKMTNYKNPCLACYNSIVKHMIARDRFSSSESLKIAYYKVGDRGTTRLHENLVDDCERSFDTRSGTFSE